MGTSCLILQENTQHPASATGFRPTLARRSPDWLRRKLGTESLGNAGAGHRGTDSVAPLIQTGLSQTVSTRQSTSWADPLTRRRASGRRRRRERRRAAADGDAVALAAAAAADTEGKASVSTKRSSHLNAARCSLGISSECHALPHKTFTSFHMRSIQALSSRQISWTQRDQEADRGGGHQALPRRLQLPGVREGSRGGPIYPEVRGGAIPEAGAAGLPTATVAGAAAAAAASPPPATCQGHFCRLDAHAPHTRGMQSGARAHEGGQRARERANVSQSGDDSTSRLCGKGFLSIAPRLMTARHACVARTCLSIAPP